MGSTAPPATDAAAADVAMDTAAAAATDAAAAGVATDAAAADAATGATAARMTSLPAVLSASHARAFVAAVQLFYWKKITSRPG
jgi:hypothetical protein